MKRKGRTKFFIAWLLIAALTLPPLTGVAEANDTEDSTLGEAVESALATGTSGDVVPKVFAQNMSTMSDGGDVGIMPLNFEGDGGSASGTNSIAIGNGSSALRDSAIALGYNTKAHGTYSIAIGETAEVPNEMDGIAIGRESNVGGLASLAIGRNTSVTGLFSAAIGAHTSATGAMSWAIGSQSIASGKYSTALGANTEAKADGSVALGDFSYVDRLTSKQGIFVPDGADTKKVSDTAIISTSQKELGVVSISDPNGQKTGSYAAGAFTRQLSGLAAGIEDTDAVNVAQLKALDSVTVRYTSAATKNEIILGDGSNTASINKLTAINLDGNASNRNYAATTGQVYNVGENAEKKLGSSFSLGTDGTINGKFSFNGTSNIATVQDALTAVDNIAVKYNSSKTSVTLGNTSTPVKLTNVKNGDSPLDAVNFSQLTETNKNIDTVSGDLGNLKDVVDGISDSLGGFAVTYDDESKTQITLGEQGKPVALKNVLAGTEDFDAVNYAQLKTVSADVGDNKLSIEDNANKITALDGIAVKYDGTDKKSITLGGTGSEAVKISNVASGDISEKSNDAVNGAQLFETNRNIETLSKDVSINTKDIEEIKGNIGTVSGDIGLLTDRVTANENKITSHDQQLTTLEGQMSHINSAITYDPVNNSLSLGKQGTPVRLTNVADGEIKEGSTEAVTGGQLFATNETIKNVSDDLGILSGKVETITGTVGALAVTYDENTDMTQITLNKGGNVPTLIKNVARGAIKADSTDAVNGGQLFVIREKLDTLGNNIADRLGGKYNETTGEFEIFHPQGPSTSNTASDSSSTTGSTGGTQTFADEYPTLNATLQNMWDAIDSKTMTAGDNITVEGDKISVSKNPEFESIKVGNINIREEGINMGGNTITGLANGGIYQGSSDAVTGDQLWNAYRRIDTIDERVQVVGAHAAALSALHPVPYNPYEPTTFSAGFGMYRNEQSVAVGVFHYVRENVLVNAGFSLNSDGDTMGRAGISFAIGKSGRKQPSMVKDVASMQHQIAAMQQMLIELKEKDEEKDATIQELKEELKKALEEKK